MALINVGITLNNAQFMNGMTQVNNSLARTGQNVSSASAGFTNFGRNVEQVGQSVTRAGQSILALVAVPIAITKQSISVGANLASFEAQYKQVFQDMGTAVSDWATEYGKTVSLTNTQVRQQVTEFYTLGRASKMNSDEALEFSKKLVRLTNDMAAFKDVRPEEALAAMKSGLMGNYEALDKLGINLSDTALKQELMRRGIKKNVVDLDANTRMQLIYEAALDSGSLAIGQAEREALQYNSRLNLLRGSVEELQMKLFLALEPALQDIVTRGIELTEMLKKLDEQTIITAAKITGIVTAVGGATFILGSVIKIVGTAITIIEVLIGVISTVSSTIAGWGILTYIIDTVTLAIYALSYALGTSVVVAAALAVAAVAAIAAAVYLIYDNWDKIYPYLLKLWDQTVIVFNQIWEFTVKLFTDIWLYIVQTFNKIADTVRPIFEFLQPLFESIWTNIVSMANSLIPLLLSLWNYILLFGDAIISVATIIWDWVTVIMSYLAPAIQFIGQVIGVLITVVIGIVAILFNIATTIGSVLVPVITVIINIMLLVGTIIFDVLYGIVVVAFNFVKGVITVFVDVVKAVLLILAGIILKVMGVDTDKAAKLLKATLDWLKNNFEWFVEGVSNVITRIIKWFGDLNNNVTKTREAWSKFTDSSRKAFDDFAESVATIYNGTIGFVLDKGKTKIEEWRQAFVTAVEMVKNVFNGLGDSISKAWNKMKGAIKMPRVSTTTVAGIEIPSISWNAKGGIFTGASVIGVGEAGDEAVVPLSNKSKMRPFASAVASMLLPNLNNDNVGGTISNHYTVNAVIREESDINKLAEQLYKLQQREIRGQGRTVLNAI